MTLLFVSLDASCPSHETRLGIHIEIKRTTKWTDRVYSVKLNKRISANAAEIKAFSYGIEYARIYKPSYIIYRTDSEHAYRMLTLPLHHLSKHNGEFIFKLRYDMMMLSPYEIRLVPRIYNCIADKCSRGLCKQAKDLIQSN